MNKKGAVDGTTGMIGVIVTVMVLLVVGVVLLQASAQQVGSSTNTYTLANASLGVMTNGTSIYIPNCQAATSVKIFNATGDVEIPSTNYTLTNYVVNNGVLSARVAPAVTVTAGVAFNKGTATIDAVCEPYGYITDSGGRAVAGLIVIMFAIALAVVALTPTLRSGVLDAMGK